jgi:hypothetical protein
VNGSGCNLLVSTTGNDYFTSKPVPTMGGKCDASGGKATLPPARFSETIRLCGSAGTGCSSGQTCFPKPPPAYEDKPCIYRMGDHACDIAGYPVKHAAHAGVDDSRGCQQCTCDPPSVGTCPAKTDLYDLSDCTPSPPINTAHHDNACVDAGGTQSWIFTITGPPQGSSCTASPGGPIGAAMPGSTFTVCCSG